METYRRLQAVDLQLAEFKVVCVIMSCVSAETCVTPAQLDFTVCFIPVRGRGRASRALEPIAARQA